MTLIGLFILVILACVVIWAAMHLPPPLNWVVVALVVVVLLVVLLGAAHVGSAHAAASWSYAPTPWNRS